MEKEWWEKEAEFEQRWRNKTYCKDPGKYVPAKLRFTAVDEATVDPDGYWVYLNEGWNMDGDRIIHAHTIADLVSDIKRIRKDR